MRKFFASLLLCAFALNVSGQTPIRIAVDSSAKMNTSVIDVNTQQSIQFVRGDTVVFEVGLFDRGVFRSNNIRYFTNISLAIYDAQNTTNPPLMAMTLSSNNAKWWNTNCSAANWASGPTLSTNQNVAFLFSNSQTYITLNGQASQSYWLRVWGITTNSIRGNITYLEAPVTVFDGPGYETYAPPGWASLIGGFGPPGISLLGTPNTILTRDGSGSEVDAKPLIGELTGIVDLTNAIFISPAGNDTDHNVQIGVDSGGDLSIFNPFGDVNIGGSEFGAFDGTLNAGLFNGAIPVTDFNNGVGASASTFLRGDWTWATPSGGGGSGAFSKQFATYAGVTNIDNGAPVTNLNNFGTVTNQPFMVAGPQITIMPGYIFGAGNHVDCFGVTNKIASTSPQMIASNSESILNCGLGTNASMTVYAIIKSFSLDGTISCRTQIGLIVTFTNSPSLGGAGYTIDQAASLVGSVPMTSLSCAINSTGQWAISAANGSSVASTVTVIGTKMPEYTGY